ncbi:MAG: thioredoxin domain-containing protein [Candidatus Nanohaloarchaea archaeon]
MSEENKCDICGRSFDSERGMKVHRSQMHDEDEKQEEKSMTPDNQDGVQTVNLTLKHAMVGVFVLGLAVGFSGGMLIGGPQVIQQDTALDPNNPSDTGNTDTGNQKPTKVAGSKPIEVFKNIAKEIGADPSKLESCYRSSSGQESAEDRREINNITGGLGTPTFFIGTKQAGFEKIKGAQPIGGMRPVINEQIGEAKNPGSDSIESDETTLQGVTLEDEPTKGDKNAPIRVIEYSDFGCPWCAEWFGKNAIPPRKIDTYESYKKLNSEYIDTGKVRFTYMDYPVRQLHPNSPKAHRAANCVLKQGESLYWKFHDALFENRGQWNA